MTPQDIKQLEILLEKLHDHLDMDNMALLHAVNELKDLLSKS